MARNCIGTHFVINRLIQGPGSIFKVYSALRSMIAAKDIERSQTWASILEKGIATSNRM